MNIHAKRIKDLQYLLKKNRLDAVVVDRKLETSFLTGYKQEGVVLLVTRNGAWGFMPKMFVDDFNAFAGSFVKASAPDTLMGAAVQKARELKLKKTAFEPETATYQSGNFWKKSGFAEHAGLIQPLRAVKEGEELELLRKSCRIAAKAFGVLKPKIKTGCTERSVACELDHIMQKMGATGPSFSLIVGFGPNSALPHHETSDRKLRNNEAVLIDYGCVYGGYCSDITRTYFHGRPSDEFRKVYAIVDRSQKAGVAKVRAGVDSRDVDSACRDIIADAGYGQYFTHSTGHGIGLEIHEAPRLSVKSTGPLAAGMAVTVEPGIYLHGRFGVRIEDSVLVTRTGREILTK